MSQPAKRAIGIIVLLLVGIAGGIGADRLWRAHGSPELSPSQPAKPAHADEDEEPEAAAVVRTAIAVEGTLERTVEAIGVAAVPATASFVESWPLDLIVMRVFVQPGERVSKDAPLAQVSVTREAETQAGAARLAAENAAKSLDLARERLERGLATRTDVLAAQSALDEARQRLDRLGALAPPKDGILRAREAGIVGTVRVQAGATVPAGTPILDIGSDAVAAQVGIDPADAAGLAVGQTFEVRPIDERAGGRWTGSISLLGQVVNPTTRLVDATLALRGDPPPRSGTPLRARQSLPGASGVVIPRAALMPDGEGMIVFLVRDGTAVRTAVTVAQRGSDMVVLASGCAPGDHVIVSGQSQLTQGATVREVAAEASPPAGGASGHH
jgi:RND family efflux transporter MFP subunit